MTDLPAKEGTLLDAEGNVILPGPEPTRRGHHQRFRVQSKVIEVSPWKMGLLILLALLMIPLFLTFGAIFAAFMIGVSLLAGLLHRLRR